MSKTGAAKGRVVVTDRVKGNELYLPMNDNGEGAINQVTTSEVDKDTDTPAYKDTAVRMEVLETEGDRPLPKNNHRFGKRTPQVGVRVEDKWARPDYIFPGDLVRYKRELKPRG